MLWTIHNTSFVYPIYFSRDTPWFAVKDAGVFHVCLFLSCTGHELYTVYLDLVLKFWLLKHPSTNTTKTGHINLTNVYYTILVCTPRNLEPNHCILKTIKFASWLRGEKRKSGTCNLGQMDMEIYHRPSLVLNIPEIGHWEVVIPNHSPFN